MNTNATNHTQYFGFPLFTGTDKPSVLTDWNGTMEELDTTLEDYRVRISGCEQTTQSFMDRLVVLKNQFDELVARVQGDENIIEQVGLDIDAVQNALLETNESVKRILTEMGTFRTDIDGLDARLNVVELSVDNLSTTVGTLNTQLNGLSNTVSEHTSSINSLNTSVSGINSSLSEVQSDISNLETDMSTANGKIETLENSVVPGNNLGENGLYASFTEGVGGNFSGREIPLKIGFFIDQLRFDEDITHHPSFPSDEIERYYTEIIIRFSKLNSSSYQYNKQFNIPIIFSKKDIESVEEMSGPSYFTYVNIDKFTPFFDVLNGSTRDELLECLQQLQSSYLAVTVTTSTLLGFRQTTYGTEVIGNLNNGFQFGVAREIRGCNIFDDV